MLKKSDQPICVKCCYGHCQDPDMLHESLCCASCDEVENCEALCHYTPYAIICEFSVKVYK